MVYPPTDGQWSPIQVLTQQWTAGSHTRNLLITGPTPKPIHHKATIHIMLCYSSVYFRTGALEAFYNVDNGTLYNLSFSEIIIDYEQIQKVIISAWFAWGD